MSLLLQAKDSWVAWDSQLAKKQWLEKANAGREHKTKFVF